MSEVAARLEQVQAEVRGACLRAGRAPGSVRLIAVSKKQPLERVREAYDAGQRDFGENYVQELERRVTELPRDAIWHMIGHVQTNKAKRALAARVIHTVDSERLAAALSKGLAPGGTADVLIEVNTGGEGSKSGVAPAEVRALAERVVLEPGLRLLGLMCIPPPGDGRPHFARLFELREALQRELGMELPELSMGMSDDFAAAILEGSTMVRVGTAIFGPRTAAGV